MERPANTIFHSIHRSMHIDLIHDQNLAIKAFFRQTKCSSSFCLSIFSFFFSFFFFVLREAFSFIEKLRYPSISFRFRGDDFRPICSSKRTKRTHTVLRFVTIDDCV